MKKLIEVDPSYYRLNLYAGNIIYFSHTKDVRDSEYIDLSIKDVIGKIDELVEACNGLTTALQNVGNDLSALKTDVKSINDKVLALEIQTQPPIVVEEDPAAQ